MLNKFYFNNKHFKVFHCGSDLGKNTILSKKLRKNGGFTPLTKSPESCKRSYIKYVRSEVGGVVQLFSALLQNRNVLFRNFVFPF